MQLNCIVVMVRRAVGEVYLVGSGSKARFGVAHFQPGRLAKNACGQMGVGFGIIELHHCLFGVIVDTYQRLGVVGLFLCFR